MKWLSFFVTSCSALIFTAGCDLTGSSGGGSGGVAERSSYSTIEKWDAQNQVATLGDGYQVIVVDGTVQRESCSWEGTVDQDFNDAVTRGSLAYYKVYISKDFKPGEPLVGNQFTIVNADCYRANPLTCGPVVLP